MISGTYGHARISKADDATRNPETQLHILQELGIREEQIFIGEMTGSSISRLAWNELMTPVQRDGTVVSPLSAPSSYTEPETSTAVGETDRKRPACFNTAWYQPLFMSLDDALGIS